jgi:hypothetical protein
MLYATTRWTIGACQFNLRWMVDCYGRGQAARHKAHHIINAGYFEGRASELARLFTAYALEVSRVAASERKVRGASCAPRRTPVQMHGRRRSSCAALPAPRAQRACPRALSSPAARPQACLMSHGSDQPIWAHLVYSGRLDSGPLAVRYQLLGPERAHVCHCKNTEYRVRQPGQLVLNQLLQPYAVVHQFDRVAELRGLVDARYHNCSLAGLLPAAPPPGLAAQR